MPKTMLTPLLNQMTHQFMQIAIYALITIFIVVFIKIAFTYWLAKFMKKTLSKTGLSLSQQPTTPILRREPLTRHEQKMYFALTNALPECIVLAQVAFSSLITTESQATRNRFDRKVADFILCSQGLNVIAIIELDDWSHQGRERQDADRDAMLKNTGYTTIRYRHVPDATTIRADIEALLAETIRA